MLQKTLATWLPRTISSTITTTAIKTRISAYSTIPWPRSRRIERQTDRMSPAKYMPALSVTDLSQSVTGPLQKKTGARAGLFLSWLPRNDQEGETEDEAEGASEGAFDAGLMMVVLPPPAPNQC